eukprot:scaffold20_cov361-Prasinococcus_capsulatus_cf.AAC.14
MGRNQPQTRALSNAQEPRLLHEGRKAATAGRVFTPHSTTTGAGWTGPSDSRVCASAVLAAVVSGTPPASPDGPPSRGGEGAGCARREAVHNGTARRTSPAHPQSLQGTARRPQPRAGPQPLPSRAAPRLPTRAAGPLRARARARAGSGSRRTLRGWRRENPRSLTCSASLSRVLTQAPRSHIRGQHDGTLARLELLRPAGRGSPGERPPVRAGWPGARARPHWARPAPPRARTWSTQSLSCWLLSPWMESAGQPSMRRRRHTSSHPRLVSRNTSSFPPCFGSSSFSNIVFSLAASRHTTPQRSRQRRSRPRLDDLLNVVVGLELAAADRHLVGVAEELARQALHLLGPRGGPVQGLAVGAYLVHDLPDLRLEAHVQHAVRLVQHQVRHPAQVGDPRLQHVDEAAGRGDADLHAAAQVANLRALGRAAVDAGVLDARGGAELDALLLDLDRQLPRRGQHKDDGPIAGLCTPRAGSSQVGVRGAPPRHRGGGQEGARTQVGLRVDVHDGGQEEGQGLARARLREPDHPALSTSSSTYAAPTAPAASRSVERQPARQGTGPARDDPQQHPRTWEGGLVEGRARLRHALPLDGDLALGPVLGHLRLRACRDVGMLQARPRAVHHPTARSATAPPAARRRRRRAHLWQAQAVQVSAREAPRAAEPRPTTVATTAVSRGAVAAIAGARVPAGGAAEAPEASRDAGVRQQQHTQAAGRRTASPSRRAASARQPRTSGPSTSSRRSESRSDPSAGY